MAEPIDNRLIDEVLKNVQTRLASLERIRDEMRNGPRVLAGAHGDPPTRCFSSAGCSSSIATWSGANGPRRSLTLPTRLEPE
jgi:hypothetical protein